MAVCLLLISGCLGGAGARSRAPANAEPALPLWSVSGVPGHVFLMGSVHVADPELFPLDPNIEGAFAASDMLWVELDPGELERASRGFVERGLLPAEQSLSELLGAEEFERVAEVARRVGLQIEVVDRMRPWLAGLTLTLGQLQSLGYSAEHGIDRHFIAEARKRDLPVRGLETAAQQVELLAGLGPELERSFLEQALDETDSLAEAMRSVFAAWRVGDAEALDAVVLRPVREASAEVYERIFTRRNAAMARQVQRLLGRRGCSFVVVGAGHLVGPDGVVERLRAVGLAVEQSRPAALASSSPSARCPRRSAAARGPGGNARPFRVGAEEAARAQGTQWVLGRLGPPAPSVPAAAAALFPISAAPAAFFPNVEARP